MHPADRIDVLVIATADLESHRLNQGTEFSRSKRPHRCGSDQVGAPKCGRCSGIGDDLARLGDGSKSGGNVDGGAEDISAPPHHGTRTDAGT